ncbi:MAG: AbrB/MazE/SpoVT family DNA-binding domain-containing protein [Methylococcales bacterium]
MRVTRKGQITIPQKVRKALGIRPAETEIDFIQDDNGRWYLTKHGTPGTSRFRTAHKTGALRISTEELLGLTRDE